MEKVRALIKPMKQECDDKLALKDAAIEIAHASNRAAEVEIDQVRQAMSLYMDSLSFSLSLFLSLSACVCAYLRRAP